MNHVNKSEWLNHVAYDVKVRVRVYFQTVNVRGAEE